jgi:two-component system response regulator YesN
MCVNGLRDICETAAGEIHWHVACGTPVTRISALPTCFIEANRLITYRYIYPEEHILSEDRISAFRQRETARAYESEALVEPELIRSFLSDGTEEEINGFVEQIRRYVGENTMKSLLFAQYLAMTICFVMAEYIDSIGCQPNIFLTPELRALRKSAQPDATMTYVRELLKRAIDLRDRESKKQKRELLVETIAYIDEHFAEESISLNMVARKVNITPTICRRYSARRRGKPSWNT